MLFVLTLQGCAIDDKYNNEKKAIVRDIGCMVVIEEPNEQLAKVRVCCTPAAHYLLAFLWFHLVPPVSLSPLHFLRLPQDCLATYREAMGAGTADAVIRVEAVAAANAFMRSCGGCGGVDTMGRCVRACVQSHHTSFIIEHETRTPPIHHITRPPAASRSAPTARTCTSAARVASSQSPSPR